MTFSYVCRELTRMESCRGEFYAATEEELLQHMDLHAKVAHQQDPSAWPAEVTAAVRAVIRTDRPSPAVVERLSA
jgi:hypothetical protein